MRRNTWTGLLQVTADCDDCEFHQEERNAAGLAAQHADRNPDHTVRVEQVTVVTYNKKDK